MKKLHTLSRLGMALAILSPALFAQERDADQPSVAFEVSQSFAEWNAQHGANWHTYSDVQTGYVQFLFGGSTEAAFAPQSDAEFFALASIAIEDTEALHGIEMGTLVEERGLHLPLGLIGSSDKYTVRYRQELGGVPVLGGAVNALFTPAGQLLSIQSSAMPGVAGMSTDAVVSTDSAMRQALAAFSNEFGLAGTVVDGPNKVIGQLTTGPKSREAVLVWQVNVQWQQDGAEPEGQSYWVDARNGGVVYNETTIHNLDVGGTINTMSTPGIHPDQASNPEVQFPMNRARVQSNGSGTVYTDANGNFNFPGVSGPITVTVQYYGDWCDVDNQAGSDYSFNSSISGTGNSLLMNPSSAALITAQSNCFQIVSAQRDWIRSINPSDNTGDFRAKANANLSSTCNAYYDGVSVNMYQAGGGCPNTAFSTVVSHEMGHWYNVLYGTGNGSDGMGEGNADVFSLYMYNTPNLGMDFFGPGQGPLRNGNNNLQFCGDASPGCHGGSVHTEGQVWMGAAWKIYKQLETAYGAAQADMISDALFLGWMNSYNQGQIKSVIETQWLTLDDDNGNINDGTPHYAELDAGFTQQGWPGFVLPDIDIVSVSQVPDQLTEIGPYTVDATAVSLIGQTITGVDLKYNVNGGAFQTIAMSSTGVDTWSGGIPGQNSPAVVRYYVEATDSLANTALSPADAPNDTYKFIIGIETVFFAEDFESGQGGWTHNTFGDTSNSQDDWQFGTPGGQSGDPGSAASGSNCWGNDLSIGNFNGAYQDNVHNYLRSPSIDCSSAVGTVLRYKRWLTVEEGIFDQARIKVNGTQVWANALNGNHSDTSWVEHEVDISAVADGNPNVQIEFSLQSDAGLTFGGWTIDDVELLFLDPVGGNCQTANYGTGKLSSTFSVPVLTALNDPSESANNFMFQVSQAVPNKLGLVFSSSAPDSAPLLGGTVLLAAPFQREGAFMTDALGSAVVAQPLDPGSSGTVRYYQAWYRDPAHTDGTGAGLSSGVEVHICD